MIGCFCVFQRCFKGGAVRADCCTAMYSMGAWTPGPKHQRRLGHCCVPIVCVHDCACVRVLFFPACVVLWQRRLYLIAVVRALTV